MIHQSLLSLICTLNHAVINSYDIIDPETNFSYQSNIRWLIIEPTNNPTIAAKKINSHFIYKKVVTETYQYLPDILKFDKEKYEPTVFSSWIKKNSHTISKIMKNKAFI